MRKIVLWSLGACLCLVVVAYMLFFVPVPLKRALYQEESPDGTMTAVYSYRPAGLIGWASGDSSYVYLDVYRENTRKRLLHFEGFGDVPWEAIDILHKDLPWPAKRTSGNPG